MLEEGILEQPLCHASRAAKRRVGCGLLPTTEVMIAEALKDDEHAHGGGAPAALVAARRSTSS
jgi:hypothetical protein